MINPQQCAERIILNNHDLAKDVFDLLLWAAGQTDLKENSDYDEIMGDLYKRMQDCRDARAAYEKTRTEPVAHDNRAELQPIQSAATKSH